MFIQQMSRIFAVALFKLQKPIFFFKVLILAPLDQELEEQKHEFTRVILFHSEGIIALSVSFFKISVKSQAKCGEIHHPFITLPRVDGIFLFQLLQKNDSRLI